MLGSTLEEQPGDPFDRLCQTFPLIDPVGHAEQRPHTLKLEEAFDPLLVQGNSTSGGSNETGDRSCSRERDAGDSERHPHPKLESGAKKPERVHDHLPRHIRDEAGSPPFEVVVQEHLELGSAFLRGHPGRHDPLRLNRSELLVLPSVPPPREEIGIIELLRHHLPEIRIGEGVHVVVIAHRLLNRVPQSSLQLRDRGILHRHERPSDLVEKVVVLLLADPLGITLHRHQSREQVKRLRDPQVFHRQPLVSREPL